MNIAKTELVEYKKDRQNKTKKWVYELSHSNKKTTLEQDFTIMRDQFGRLSADVKLLDFPVFHDKKEAATKIGFTHYHSDFGKSICDTIDLCPFCIEKKHDQLNIVVNAESAKREHLALINRKLFKVVNK